MLHLHVHLMLALFLKFQFKIKVKLTKSERLQCTLLTAFQPWPSLGGCVGPQPRQTNWSTPWLLSFALWFGAWFQISKVLTTLIGHVTRFECSWFVLFNCLQWLQSSKTLLIALLLYFKLYNKFAVSSIPEWSGIMYKLCNTIYQSKLDMSLRDWRDVNQCHWNHISVPFRGQIFSTYWTTSPCMLQ